METVHQQIQTALKILRKGGVVAYPTDTVYGLGAAARNLSAVRRVYDVKMRPRTMALPILISDLDMMKQATAEIPSAALELAKAFWPGALTMILRKSSWIPDLVTAGTSTIALRIPNHPTPRALAKGMGMPLVGTSANKSGQPSVTTARGVLEQLGADVDYVIGGRCKGGVESTIVDMTQSPPRILRKGPITGQQISSVLGMAVSA